MAQDIVRTVQGLNGSMEALAALAALLRIRDEGLEADPAISALLARAAEAIDPGLLASVAPAQGVIALSLIRSHLAQALDFIDDPARRPGWVYEQPEILLAQGAASRVVVHNMAALGAEDARFARLLQGQRRFLDIGTGVGGIAIEAARTWPGFSVTGIDVHAPALALARQALAASEVADRVRFRHRGIAEVAEVAEYDLIWLPGPFIPRGLVEAALPGLRSALTPGGALVFGFYGWSPTPLAAILTELRVVRSGGYPWSEAEVLGSLAAAGFQNPRAYLPQSPATLVVAYGPEG